MFRHRVGFPERTLSELENIVAGLPLPIAQLARRALRSQSPIELHHNAYYLAEATLKLASAARIGLWLAGALDPSSALARRLEALTYPSLGQWRDFLRDTDRVLAHRGQGEGAQGMRYLGRLSEPRPDWTAVPAFALAAEQSGAVSEEAAKTGRSDGLLGFFDLVVSYRNRVIAHGGQRVESYYEELGNVLLLALQEVLACEELFGGQRLVYARIRIEADGDSAALFWQDLTGPTSAPLESHPAETGARHQPERSMAGRVCMLGPSGVCELHPLVVYRTDEAGRESFGFLNRTIRRGDGGAQVRRVDYLDYDTGENVGGMDTRPALTALIGRLRGQQATVQDLEAAQDASLAGADPEPEGAPVPPGETVGDYEIHEELGRGSMGVVYRARQCSLGRRVALKVLPHSLAGDSAMLRRFRNEISALARCDHPNVIRILTSGIEGDRYYYAMDLVDGADLARTGRVLTRWRSAGAMLREAHVDAAVHAAMKQREGAEDAEDRPPGDLAKDVDGRSFFVRIAELFAGACTGLDHLHERGILHRDLKPSNLLLTADGRRLVITDLGLARLHDIGTVASRSDGRILGTLRYAAPEQLVRRLGDVDYRADLYSLGASLYETATGRPMFDGDTESRLVKQILYETPPAPRSVERRIPHDLAAIVEVATSREPLARYPSAAAFAEDLRAFASGRAPPVASAWKRAPLLRLARRKPVALGVTSLIAAGALAAATAVWSWNRTRTVYCAELLHRWEGPFCATPLPDSTRSPLSVRYRLSSQRGKVDRVERLNGSGWPQDDERGEARWEYVWSEAGTVVSVFAFDASGTATVQWAYSPDLSRAERRDPSGNPKPEEGTEISVLRIEHDSRGFRRSIAFHNIYGYPIADKDKRFGQAFTTDSQGRALEVINLGEDGRPAPSRSGILKEVMVRGADGRESARDRLDASGGPALGRTGVSGYRVAYDAVGNPTSWTWVGGAGQPVADEDGNAGWRADHDERGNRVGWRLVNVEGGAGRHRDGYAGWTATYDDKGRMVGQRYLDGRGEPVSIGAGYAGWTRGYDERGRLVREAHVDPNGQPTLCKEGYFERRLEWDSAGRQVGERYLDRAGKPVMTSRRYAGWRAEYDSRGNEVLRVFLGLGGEPTLTAYGHAGWRAEHDERGTQVQITYLDASLQPGATLSGYASVRTLYNSRGEIIESSFFDPQGRPIATPDGYAVVRRHYDRRGNPIEESYWGVDGKPALHRRGYFAVRTRYDERGNPVEETHHGIDGGVVKAP